jgi:hypothetical protein
MHIAEDQRGQFPYNLVGSAGRSFAVGLRHCAGLASALLHREARRRIDPQTEVNLGKPQEEASEENFPIVVGRVLVAVAQT